MATTGIINGTLIKIKLDGTAMDNLTSNDESFQNDLREVTTKDSGGNAEFDYGKFSGTYSAEFLEEQGAAKNYDALLAIMIARTKPTAIVTSGVTGDTQYTCTVLVKDVKRANPLEANSTGSVTLQVTGAVTPSTV